MGLLDKIKSALSKTSEKISIAVTGKKIDEEFIQDLEDALIMADLGTDAASALVSKISDKKFHKEATDLDIKQFLASEIEAMLKPYEFDFFAKSFDHNPEIVLVIGVNGNGKTTTIAKMANIFYQKNPLVVAGDTFRAAAVEQLKYWADVLNIDISFGDENADAAGLVFSSIERACSNNNGVVLIDTAGRMQNRDDLLAELEKIKRVIKKLDHSAPHTTILVIDGLTGQATHSQVKVFSEKIGVDGIIITKLDGTAKGGALIPLTQKFKIPIIGIGVGEGVSDLKPFCASDFARAIVGL